MGVADRDIGVIRFHPGQEPLTCIVPIFDTNQCSDGNLHIQCAAGNDEIGILFDPRFECLHEDGRIIFFTGEQFD